MYDFNTKFQIGCVVVTFNMFLEPEIDSESEMYSLVVMGIDCYKPIGRLYTVDPGY